MAEGIITLKSLQKTEYKCLKALGWYCIFVGFFFSFEKERKKNTQEILIQLVKPNKP